MGAGIIAGPRPAAQAQTAQPGVFIIPIHNEIDLGLAAHLVRVLEQAERENAAAVILDINTPGGRLDAALQMREALLSTPVRTIAFVNRQAFSAGALLAIAAGETYLTPGAVLGAALPVTADGEPAGEKTISAVEQTFRATAELRGRDPRVAAAMVDPDVAIDGLIDRGKLLTLTTNEAVRWGYTDGVVATRQDLLAAAGLAGLPLHETSLTWAENVVRLLTNPLVSSLLLALGFLLVLLDLSSGGIGIISAVGLGLLALFFWGHLVAGLAGWEGIVLVLLGLVLIGVEVFVIPGFGVAGILGLIALLAGLFLSLINEEMVTPDDLARAGATLAGTLTLVAVGGALLLWLVKATGFGGLVLQAQVGLPEARSPARRPRWVPAPSPAIPDSRPLEPRPTPAEPAKLTGATGVALTDLRPGGFARIAGQRVDVVTQGDYLSAGEPIEVIADEGYRRVVRRRESVGRDGGAGAR